MLLLLNSYKKTKMWGVDKDKKEKIKWAAQRYLKGDSMSQIAKDLGMNHSNLWKFLKHRSGTTWEVKFNSKRFKINKTQTYEIPELLPKETIAAIHKKAKSNKTYEHGKIKNKYLFSRLIFLQKNVTTQCLAKPITVVGDITGTLEIVLMVATREIIFLLI